MKRGPSLSATARMERARETTKAAVGRELLYAGILARMWPSVVMRSGRKCDDGWFILAVESPVGWLSWKLSPEERDAFDWVPMRDWHGEKVEDRTPLLLALATNGW